MPVYRILSFDGGGVRGVLMLSLVLRLDALVPGWRREIDLYAGTSAGALIALGLAAGFGPAELLARFRSALPGVFEDSWWDDARDLGTALGADYSAEGLTRETRALFGERRLDQLDARVIIPSIRLDTPTGAKPKFFHNMPGPDSDGSRLVADVARYSAAAPVFFPSIDGYADGGLVANHPGMAAIALTQDPRAEMGERPSLGDIRLLSVGSGEDTVRLGGSGGDWGWVRWARPLIRMLVESTVAVPDYQCRQLLGDGYCRLNARFAEGAGPAIDDVSSATALENLAWTAMSADVGASAAWLERKWIAGQSRLAG
jgi:hypothetical protein